MEEERTSPGGIVIPDAATEKPIKGEVIAAGKGKILDNGEIRALDVKVGDKVLFGKYAGTEVKVDGKELLVMQGRRHHGDHRGLRLDRQTGNSRVFAAAYTAARQTNSEE